MSKVLVVAYKVLPYNVEEDIRNAFSIIEPNNVENEVGIFQLNSNLNTFVGVLNPETNIDLEAKKITSGHVIESLEENGNLDDGAYFNIEWDEKGISFNVDRFESKSLWFFLDEEKFILSNSQLLITSLKKSFDINKKAISWFLSSGSTGYNNAWDTKINKVTHSNQYEFSFIDWKLATIKKEYAVKNVSFSSEKSFLQKYKDFTSEVFLNLSNKISVQKMVLPLSGGNDSRLLFYLSNQLEEYKDLAIANWGVKRETNVFDDKKAANRIAQYYNKPLKDYYLPSEIENLDCFFETYVKKGDCRIDHFNAYSDKFRIFEQLFNEKYRIIIRGDIPFTEGIDLNDKMARLHIGIPKWTDYGNYTKFILDDFVSIQEGSTPLISKKADESLIEWRDRLYIDYRIPIVISSFDDLINSYLVTVAPMMSYSHYLLYNQQKDNKKGDKKHIVKLSEQLDKSQVKFNATSSILSMDELLNTEKNIEYLQNYLKTMNNTVFSKEMITSVLQEISYKPLQKSNSHSLKRKVLELVKNNMPIQIKSLLKAKQTLNISGLTLAYRMVMVDKVYKIFNQDQS